MNAELSARALALWRESDRRRGTHDYRRTGVLWMAGADDSYVRDALPLLRNGMCRTRSSMRARRRKVASAPIVGADVKAGDELAEMRFSFLRSPDVGSNAGPRVSSAILKPPGAAPP